MKTKTALSLLARTCIEGNSGVHLLPKYLHRDAGNDESVGGV